MYKYASAIGIDIGRTGIKYGIVRYDGMVLNHDRIQYNQRRNREAVLKKLITVVKEMLDYASDNKINPLSIGIGSPGFVDPQTGVILGAALHIRDWKDIPLGETISGRFGIPAFVDNDATLYGYAEWLFGAARNRENVLFVSLRSGIGGAIVVNGKLYRGNHNAAGEFGQMSINFRGARNKWGGRGTLESYAGAEALVKHYNRLVKKRGNGDLTVTTAKPVFDRFNQGERVAADAVRENAFFLGIGLGNLVNIFSPGLIVLGGGMALGGKQYISLIRESLVNHAMDNCVNDLKIITARLKEKAGFIGAAHYALERLDGKIP
ncbi:MAG: ROK family protein [Chlorobi bacterium]|nr:ROK family protein [Chlorobiota bacterium]